jgi:hypothetical protein
MMSLRPVIGVSMALSLPACHLIDQRDFDAQAGRKPVPVAATARPEPLVPPLVTIRFTQPDPPYRDALTDAVRRALARKPDVLFTVSTTVPQGASPDEDTDLGARAAESGREVAETIVGAGAPAANVEQLVSIDPNAKIREVVVRVH